MKFNNLFSTLILVLLCNCIYAQKRVTFGIQGGVNYSSLRFQNEKISEHDSEISYLLGVSTNFYLNDKLSLDLELNYDRKVVSVFVDELIINSISYGGNYRVFDMYEFLTLPIMLKYKLGDYNPYYLKGGAFIGCFLTAKERINKGELSNDLSKFFTDFDFGFSLAIGKQFSINKSNKLFIELRNNLGITNIDNDPKSQYTKTNSMNFIVGWNLVL